MFILDRAVEGHVCEMTDPQAVCIDSLLDVQVPVPLMIDGIILEAQKIFMVKPIEFSVSSRMMCRCLYAFDT